MKILREFDNYQIESYIVESENKSNKDYVLEGIFTITNEKNKNGRVYPDRIFEREVYKLQQKIAENNFITGCLDHPSSPDIKLDEAAIGITNIKKDGNKVYGKAKILKETPKGKIAMALFNEGLKFGISSRGVGSIQEKEGINYVCEDYNLLTYDIVADPSCASAWLTSALSEKHWMMNNGILTEDTSSYFKEKLDTLPKNDKEEYIKNIFEEFIKSI